MTVNWGFTLNKHNILLYDFTEIDFLYEWIGTTEKRGPVLYRETRKYIEFSANS